MSTLTVTSKATPAPSLRHGLASHPFVAFFVLAFTGSWLFFAPMLVGQDGLGLLPYSVPFWLYVVLFLAASFSGPTVAALLEQSAFLITKEPDHDCTNNHPIDFCYTTDYPVSNPQAVHHPLHQGPPRLQAGVEYPEHLMDFKVAPTHSGNGPGNDCWPIPGMLTPQK